MRARDFIIEFKAPAPAPQAASSSEEAISTLTAIGQSAEENPEVLALAHDAVAKAKQLAQQILAKVQTDSKKPLAPAAPPLAGMMPFPATTAATRASMPVAMRGAQAALSANLGAPATPAT